MNNTMRNLLILVLGLGSLMLASNADANTGWSKHDIQSLIVSEAERQGMLPALALAVARVESDFNPMAVSSAGARGVMQIMPATAEDVLGVSRYALHNPKVNIRAGITFLRQLIDTYDGRWDIALSHYNGGSAVRTRAGGLRVIPATRGYVDRVLAFAREYGAATPVRSTPRFSVASAGSLDDFGPGGRFISRADDRGRHDAGQLSAERAEVVAALERLARRNADRSVAVPALPEIDYGW